MNYADRGQATTTVDVAPDAIAVTLFSVIEVADELKARVEEALATVGLSYPKYELLKHLRDAEEPVPLGVLAEGRCCARSNITQLVDRLEREGLVRRVPDPDDRRSVRAELTELGAAGADEGAAHMARVIADFSASLTGPERVELGRLLGKIL